MASRIMFALLGIIIVGLVIDRMRDGRDDVSPPAPPPSPTTLEVGDVIAYSTTEATTYRVRTTRDVLPGGYAAAMAPILVDWDRSDLSAGGYVIVRNINDGGNPISGVTNLRTARIHFGQVKAAELIMVPLGGPEAVSHGQLRFIFEKGGAEYLGANEGAVGEPDVFEDLVLSWEAWRPPGVGYDVLTGMNPRNYELSLRGYSGRQRFLEDALGDLDWNVYRLQLPGGSRGLNELLKVAIALGDGAARHSIGRMLEEAEDQWVASGPDSETEGGDALAQWQAIAERVRRTKDLARDVSKDDRIDMAGRTGYQSLLRSCATMALYSIDVAVARLLEAGVPAEGMRRARMAAMDDEPEWMAEIASANIAGIFARGPAALRFVRANPTVIPGNIPGVLDEAGLLIRKDSKPLHQRYSMSAETPWGHPDQLLIR